MISANEAGDLIWNIRTEGVELDEIVSALAKKFGIAENEITMMYSLLLCI